MRGVRLRNEAPAGAGQGEARMFTAQDLVNAIGNEAAILDIFRNNVVMSTYGESQNTGAVHHMTVAQGWGITPYLAKKADGTVIDVMSIVNKPCVPGPATFQAYWCPFKGNDCKLAHLGGAASYMFTAKMDGCTFAIGTAGADGSRVVAHANLGGKGLDQLDQIKGKAEFQGDAGMRYLGPAAYRYSQGTMGTEATTFGIRLASGQWKFFSQVVLIDKTAKTMQLVEVIPLA
jgi:hypothetical protein